MAPSTSPSFAASPLETVISLPSNQKRASTPKVRTGCITCKNRHVKCDERKPTCSRCEKARMECHGYLAKTDHKTTRKSNKSATVRGGPRPLQMIRPAPSPLFCTEKDIIYHDFYRYSLVNDLAGYLHADFWSRIVLCESIRDDCVQHAILAIGALSQALFIDSTGFETLLGHQSTGSSPSPAYPRVRRQHGLNPHYRVAIHHQNQAISLCLQRTRDDRMTARTLLAITLLLVTYEILQGDIEAADGLMTSGIRLLRDSIMTLRGTASRQHMMSIFANTKDADMEDMEYILPFFSVMSGNSNLCPRQLPHHQSLTSALEDNDLPVFGKTSAVKCTYLWGNFHARCILFITQAMQRTFCRQGLSSGVNSSLMQEQTNFLKLLRQWQHVLSDYKAAVHPEDLRTKRIMRLLNLQYYTSFICLTRCLDPTDTALDNCEVEFGELLQIAHEFLNDPEPMSTIGFTFSGGNIAGPLILVATKCRANRELRLKALEAFRKMSWRGGAWDAKMFVAVVGLVMLEEATRDKRGVIDPISRWIWTGVHSDVDSGRVVGEYTRIIPDDKGEPIKRYLALDLDRWGLAKGEEIDLNLANVDIDIGCYGNGHTQGQIISQGLGLDIGGCTTGGLSPASAATGTSDLDSPSPGLRECLSNWEGLSSCDEDATFDPDSMNMGAG
ncbi:hypothetical protein B0T21DRAFT_376414 [Apiosordaria backusii]|uniref:Zn(2)-C6 fungal-type domain-containing protein n=1 Tax=Apiosordaria backusii TaxID=314023 RepID=A0AA40DSZ8_9PEZI|nr:hypothetical protein B0T21DRAFT_376414 [Apiosordaria backusii]